MGSFSSDCAVQKFMCLVFTSNMECNLQVNLSLMNIPTVGTILSSQNLTQSDLPLVGAVQLLSHSAQTAQAYA